MASRLRKTFKYPTDDDSHSSDEDLDEEHQEALIHSLQAEDKRKTDLYRTLFLSIPLAATIFYIYNFLIASTARQRLISILAISSLAATAYILKYQPIESEKKGKRAGFAFEGAKGGPIERFLVWVNAGLAGVLVLAAGLSWRAGRGEEAVREVLPGMVMGLMLVVRVLLAPVDLGELQGARFELKGA